jgi:arylsulfatase A-like enzyme
VIEANRNRPFFLYLAHWGIHNPLQAKKEDYDALDRIQDHRLRVYAAMITALDRSVGRVLDALQGNGLTDNTLVIFTSDNGGWEGATDNRPLRAGKGELFEGGLRVPLIVRWPGVTAPGTTNDTPVVSMDLSATILDAAGVRLAAGESLDGVSLRPLLRGKALDRDALYFHYPHYAFHKSNRPGGAIRSGPYKLIRRYDDDSVELYDLAADPGERANLAARKPDLAARLDARLGRWLKDTDAQLPSRRAVKE